MSDHTHACVWTVTSLRRPVRHTVMLMDEAVSACVSRLSGSQVPLSVDHTHIHRYKQAPRHCQKGWPPEQVGDDRGRTRKKRNVVFFFFLSFLAEHALRFCFMLMKRQGRRQQSILDGKCVLLSKQPTVHTSGSGAALASNTIQYSNT